MKYISLLILLTTTPFYSCAADSEASFVEEASDKNIQSILRGADYLCRKTSWRCPPNREPVTCYVNCPPDPTSEDLGEDQSVTERETTCYYDATNIRPKVLAVYSLCSQLKKPGSR